MIEDISQNPKLKNLMNEYHNLSLEVKKLNKDQVSTELKNAVQDFKVTLKNFETEIEKLKKLSWEEKLAQAKKMAQDQKNKLEKHFSKKTTAQKATSKKKTTKTVKKSAVTAKKTTTKKATTKKTV